MPLQVRAAVPIMAAAEIYPIAFAPGGAVSLELLTMWTYLIYALQRSPAAGGRLVSPPGPVPVNCNGRGWGGVGGHNVPARPVRGPTA